MVGWSTGLSTESHSVDFIVVGFSLNIIFVRPHHDHRCPKLEPRADCRLNACEILEYLWCLSQENTDDLPVTLCPKSMFALALEDICSLSQNLGMYGTTSVKEFPNNFHLLISYVDGCDLPNETLVSCSFESNHTWELLASALLINYLKCLNKCAFSGSINSSDSAEHRSTDLFLQLIQVNPVLFLPSLKL